jgi:cytoskeleton protein RodZ
MRGVSLDEIVATTKIGRRLLVALEEEQFDLLPGGIFNKAYVRAYAKCVGIDEEAAVAEYLEAAQEPAADTRVIAQQHASIHADGVAGRSGFPVVPVLILVVVAAGAAGGWKLYQERLLDHQQRVASTASDSSVGEPSQSALATPSPAQSSAAPAPSKLSTSTESSTSEARPSSVSGPTAPAAGAFELTIRPTDSAWVSVKSDGKYVVRGIIKPPDVRTIRASSEVVFFTGNAGHIEIAFNGKNVPLQGGSNQEQTLIFDSRGVTQHPPKP